MTIRQATLEDESIVLELVRHFLAGTSYGQLLAYNPAQLSSLFQAVLAMGGVVFLAVRNNETVGLIGLAPCASPISGERFVEELVWWVEPEHRNGTAGPRLLLEAEHWTRQIGVSVLKMVAPADTDVGVFYSRSGYRAIETAYVKDLTDGVHDARSDGPRCRRRRLRREEARTGPGA